MDETLDTLFVNLNPQEFGALHQLSKQDYEDAKLLDTQTSLKETADKEALKRFDPFAKPLPFRYSPSVTEELVEDAVKHPLAGALTAAEFGMAMTNPAAYILPTADAISGIYDYVKDSKAAKYIPELGSPYEFIRHMDENPGDWLHLIGANSKLQGMIANPEDYAE